MSKLKVLFLCTGNSCRSQMAEGFARALKGDVIEASSAGIERHGMNQRAVRAMSESGVSLDGQFSKTLDELVNSKLNDGTTEANYFDLVITVCGHAHETCPWFPSEARVIHQGFDDPPKLAATLTDEEQIMDCYRRVRDEIRAFIMTLPESLTPAEV